MRHLIKCVPHKWCFTHTHTKDRAIYASQISTSKANVCLIADEQQMILPCENDVRLMAVTFIHVYTNFHPTNEMKCDIGSGSRWFSEGIFLLIESSTLSNVFKTNWDCHGVINCQKRCGYKRTTPRTIFIHPFETVTSREQKQEYERKSYLQLSQIGNFSKKKRRNG